jgi:hypothetical protein
MIHDGHHLRRYRGALYRSGGWRCGVGAPISLGWQCLGAAHPPGYWCGHDRGKSVYLDLPVARMGRCASAEHDHDAGSEVTSRGTRPTHTKIGQLVSRTMARCSTAPLYCQPYDTLWSYRIMPGAVVALAFERTSRRWPSFVRGPLWSRSARTFSSSPTR